MRIHQTAIWRVRHKRPFSVHSAGTPPKLLNPTKSHPFLVHFAGPRQNSVPVTTRCYLPEISSLGVTLLPYDRFSNMEHVRSQKKPVKKCSIGVQSKPPCRSEERRVGKECK